ncbi:unnamed protein product [Ranitomeya imitator]|uniref:Uncharacterized protein n=1 Tax=Ranitomeya imitator TaxID=111125 RepID=A0ABN9L598_9NEOB|nr:unnamed protein product [Ranitomeya imitator]
MGHTQTLPVLPIEIPGDCSFLIICKIMTPHRSDASNEYSDWTTDAGINLQPPSRNSTRRKVKKLASSSEDESSTVEKSTEEKSTPKRERPRKTTIENEIIYFRQGHEAYINAVQRSNLRIGNTLKEPWRKCVLRGHLFHGALHVRRGIDNKIKYSNLKQYKSGLVQEERTLPAKAHNLQGMGEY